jgi:dGTPase
VYLALIDMYDKTRTFDNLKKLSKDYPMLCADFIDFLCKYVDKEILGERTGQYKRYKNEKIYGMLETKQIYAQAIIDFISGMTDRYAIEIYNELLKY